MKPNMAHPRSASPSRGRHQWPGKAGSTVARGLILGLATLSGVAFAQMTPLGTWRSIDDKTGEAKAEIRIFEQGGALYGRIEKRLAKDAKRDEKGRPVGEARRPWGSAPGGVSGAVPMALVSRAGMRPFGRNIYGEPASTSGVPSRRKRS